MKGIPQTMWYRGGWKGLQNLSECLKRFAQSMIDFFPERDYSDYVNTWGLKKLAKPMSMVTRVHLINNGFLASKGLRRLCEDVISERTYKIYESIQRRVCARGLGLWENIKKAISNFDWNKAFENLSRDGKVDFLNETLLNIFWNCIPNKKIKCDYQQPPWMANKIKKYFKER